MSPLTVPPSASLPNLDSRDLKALVDHTYDVLIALDAGGLILSVSQDIELKPMDLYGWIGTNFQEILTEESKVKLPLLLGNSFTALSGSSLWRHINLRLGSDQVLPILAKYAEFGDSSSSTVRFVFGRDLRPLQRLQRKLTESHNEVVKNYEQLAQAVNEKSLLLDRKISELVPYDKIFADAESSSLGQSLEQFFQTVKRNVVRRKLEETNGNIAEVASALEISTHEVEDLSR
jgi:hypothetical protein